MREDGNIQVRALLVQFLEDHECSFHTQTTKNVDELLEAVKKTCFLRVSQRIEL